MQMVVLAKEPEGQYLKRFLSEITKDIQAKLRTGDSTGASDFIIRLFQIR